MEENTRDNDGVCHFYRLPRELRDWIYHCAYPEGLGQQKRVETMRYSRFRMTSQHNERKFEGLNELDRRIAGSLVPRGIWSGIQVDRYVKPTLEGVTGKRLAPRLQGRQVAQWRFRLRPPFFRSHLPTAALLCIPPVRLDRPLGLQPRCSLFADSFRVCTDSTPRKLSSSASEIQRSNSLTPSRWNMLANSTHCCDAPQLQPEYNVSQKSMPRGFFAASRTSQI